MASNKDVLKCGDIEGYKNTLFYFNAADEKLKNGKTTDASITMWFQVRRSFSLNIIMLIWTNLVNPEANVFLLIVAMVTAKNKIKVFNFFSYACLMVFVVMCLKSVFMDPRPYMINPKIIPLEKYAEYGNPSGHVFMGYIVMSYVLENFLYCQRKQKLKIKSNT